jgi:hypothetical protein
VIDACGWTLLRQGQELEQAVPGESWSRARGVVRGWLGRRDGDAKSEGAPIGHHDVAGALGRMADGEDLEASAVEGMGGVGHLDDLGIQRRWVLEGGIMLLDRSTTSIVRLCCQPSNETSSMTGSYN